MPCVIFRRESEKKLGQKEKKIILNMHMKGYISEQIAECVEKTVNEVEAVIAKREHVLA